MSAARATGWARDPIHAAGGRRRYNAQRRAAAQERQAEILRLVRKGGHDLLARGTTVTLARHLGVSHGTVGRDIRALFGSVIDQSDRCAMCGARPITPDGIETIASGLDRLTDRKAG